MGGYRDKLFTTTSRLFAAERKPGGVYVAQVRHDDWCPKLKNEGECTCNAEVEVRPARDVGDAH